MANRSSRGWIKAAVGPSVLERAEVIGDSSADFIKASGHVNRANRPDTWVHPTAVPIVRISLHHGGRPHMDPIGGTTPDGFLLRDAGPTPSDQAINLVSCGG